MLNFLADSIKSERLSTSGHVEINGINRDKFKYSEYIAYVEMESYMLETMTVKECLIFGARMKLPNKVDYEARVDSLIHDLHLDTVAHVKYSSNSLSFDVKKKISIGIEIITNPSLIFMDEPTTGTDSNVAKRIINVIRNLIKSGRTVIASIHQPTSEIFKSLDKLMILSSGKVIYLQEAKLVSHYFRTLGIPFPKYMNPAECIINMLTLDSLEIEAETEAEFKQKHLKLEREMVERNDYFVQKYIEVDDTKTVVKSSSEPTTIERIDYQTAGYLKQLLYLTIRAFVHSYRMLNIIYLKF